MKDITEALDAAIRECRKVRRRRLMSVDAADDGNKYGGRKWDLGAVAGASECVEALERLKRRVGK